MKRRQLLAGLGVSAISPAFKTNSSARETGPVIFVQSDLTYEVESETSDEIQGVHIDQPPEFIVRGKDLELMEFAIDRTVEMVKSRESVINFRGIKEFPDRVPEKSTTKILPVNSGSRNQLSFGLALKNEIVVPGFGVQKQGQKHVELRAFDEETTLKPSEDVTLVGSSKNVVAKKSNPSSSVEITVTPKLSVSNLGVLTPRIVETQ